MEIELERPWRLGRPVAHGGFGRVFEAESPGVGPCVAKLIPKDPGAERELLFVDLSGIRNVVPIIDRGEADNHWVLIMPRAQCSLRDRLKAGEIPVEDALTAMKDIVDALVDLSGCIVHRDLKPENTLWLDDHWCLADFGISRYAEATTAPDTRKYAFTGAYAAPERWRHERATSATDVYSFGVMAHEMLSAALPFDGSSEGLRDAHLHQAAPLLQGITPTLAALVAECMSKPPGVRPTATVISERLRRESSTENATARSGLAKLQESNLQQVARQREEETRASARISAKAARAELYQSAQQTFRSVSSAMYDEIVSSASAAAATSREATWTITLGQATLTIGPMVETSTRPWKYVPPAFDVVAHSEISIEIPVHNSYTGRSHSLWFCDAQDAGSFQWFEAAFMFMPLVPRQSLQDPFAIEPGGESAQALGPALGLYQMAWPFEPLNADTVDAFVDRWAAWLADAANGRLVHPSHMPERDSEGSWRR